MRNIRCIHDGRFKLAEGPLWCDRSQALFWVNMIDPSTVYKMHWSTGEIDSWPSPGPATGLALTDDGMVLVGSVGCLLRLDPTSGHFARVLKFENDIRGNRCNELGVDPRGNLWVGTMTNNLENKEIAPGGGALFRIDATGHAVKVMDGIGIPNTLEWNLAGDELTTADSMTGVIDKVNLNPATGKILSKKILFGAAEPGIPDGSAMSSDGTLWNARWTGGCILGILPNGRITSQICIPGGNITSAAFCGPERTTLAVTTSIWGLDEDELSLTPKAGGIFSVEQTGEGHPTRYYSAHVSEWSEV